MKVVIIGGVAGGATAAARLRRLDENAEILMLERSGYISYANCGLPYYAGGVIKDPDALTLQTPEHFWDRFRVQVRVRHEAVSIDREAHTVEVRSLADGAAYTETYDKLLLAPGARPIRPNLPGIDGERVFTLRTVEDAFRIRAFLEQEQPKSALVAGGGFIGLEMAENLAGCGIAVTVAEQARQVMAPLDGDMACLVQGYLREKGVACKLGSGVASLEEKGGKLRVQLQNGETVDCDMAVMAVGVAPDTKLAKEAGLDLSARGAIVVDTAMRTSDPDIFAVGDAVEILDRSTGAKGQIPLAGPANKQARIAADQICGKNSRYNGALGTSIVKLFGLAAASTGLNEKKARASGIRYDKAVTFSASHATYYPGASNMTVKTIFDPETGRILGAQIVGFDGVDKRIDVLAAAIHSGMTAQDLTELDLSYAPPFSSAKDPVNMAGYVIENLRDGLVRQFHWHDVAPLLHNDKITLLDVRTPAEFSRGHLPGAVNLPLDGLREHLAELDPEKPVYVNCQSGLRSYLACRILSAHGFACSHLSGGYRFYQVVAREGRFDGAPCYDCGVPVKQ